MLHLYSHEGHFGNEVADVAADQGRQDHIRLSQELQHRWPDGVQMGTEGEGTNEAPTEERRSMSQVKSAAKEEARRAGKASWFMTTAPSPLREEPRWE